MYLNKQLSIKVLLIMYSTYSTLINTLLVNQVSNTEIHVSNLVSYRTFLVADFATTSPSNPQFTARERKANTIIWVHSPKLHSKL